MAACQRVQEPRRPRYAVMLVMLCVVGGGLGVPVSHAGALTDCVVGPGCPQAFDDAYTTPLNVKLSVPAPGVLANDSGPSSADPNGPTTVDVADSDATSWNGADVSIHANGSFTYTPDPTNPFTGIDSFDYWIQDSQGDTDFATVYVTVPAIVRDDSYRTRINQTLHVNAPGIFANDVGVDPTTVTNDVGSAQGGFVDVADDGSFDYTPPTSFTGTDSFTYQVWDLDFDIQYSATVDIVVVGAPAPPSNVAGVAADGAATVSWTTPASDGGLAITTYTVTAAPGGTKVTVGGSQTSATMSGLVNGTTYTFTVTATNIYGTSDPSPPSNAVVPAGLPFPPSQVVGTDVGTGEVTISWSASLPNGSPIVSYTVSGAPGGPSMTITPTRAGCENGIVLCSADVTGLTNGLPYTFTVVATNSIGTSDASSPSNAVVPAGIPSAPAGATAVAGNRQATVSWIAPSPNGSAIGSYTVTSSPGAKATTVSSSHTDVTLTGLQNGIAYRFTVVATNAIGTSEPSRASNVVVPAGAPSPPTGVHASQSGTSVLVSWSAASDDGAAITGYTVIVSPGGHTLDLAASTTHVRIGGLRAGYYTFRVRARNRVGTSTPSAPSPRVVIAQSVASYTARYNDSQYAFLVKTAAFFRLNVNDVPKSGVLALDYFLTLSRPAASKPITPPPASVGNHAIVTTWVTGTGPLLDVERHYGLDGNQALWLGGVLLMYVAAIEGVH